MSVIRKDNMTENPDICLHFEFNPSHKLDYYIIKFQHKKISTNLQTVNMFVFSIIDSTNLSGAHTCVTYSVLIKGTTKQCGALYNSVV